MLNEDTTIDILSAKLLSEFQIKLCFSDGFERIIDFAPFLKKSNHPDIQKYLDPNRFASFYYEGGDLVWNDYELCFPLNDLYDGTI